jgi:hypothetical protein
MTEAFICAAVRTPIGRYGGALGSVRADDLGRRARCKCADGAHPTSRLGTAVDDVIYGCANQAGEDNRNVARMATACWPACRQRSAGHHGQPPVRFRHGCRRRSAARSIKSRRNPS